MFVSGTAARNPCATVRMRHSIPVNRASLFHRRRSCPRQVRWRMLTIDFQFRFAFPFLWASQGWDAQAFPMPNCCAASRVLRTRLVSAAGPLAR